MKKLTTYFTFIICLFFLQVNAQIKTALDLGLTNNSALNTEFKKKTSLWQQDSTLYTQRIDSLNSTMCLVYNPQVQKYINAYTGKRKSEMCNMLVQSKYYFPIFEKALKAYNIPQVFKFLPVIESGLYPHAISKSGATGLWQFMYATARGYGLVIDDYVDERKDPLQASYAAAKYLREAYNELGDWFLALAAYNCGTGTVKKAILKAGGRNNIWQLQPFLSVQTQNYIPAFIAAVYVMSYPNKHQIFADDLGLMPQTDIIYVSRFLDLRSFCRHLNLPLKQLIELNPSYKKQIINGTKQVPKKLIMPQISKLLYANLYNQLNPTEAIAANLDLENPNKN